MKLAAFSSLFLALLQLSATFTLRKATQKVGSSVTSRSPPLNAETSEGRLVQLITPPPNLTGDLHIGNALNLVCSDIFLRYSELKQQFVYVRFGSDHAGHGLERIINLKLGPESAHAERLRAALLHCKAVRSDHLKTLRSLGVDWLDDGWTLSRRNKDVAREAFVELFRQGHITERLYPTFAKVTENGVAFIDVADVEFVSKPVTVFSIGLRLLDGNAASAGNGELRSGETEHNIYRDAERIKVNTTNPALLHASVAVAVPEKVYEQVRGKVAVLPGSNREIPMVPVGRLNDTGAALVCPGYSEADFQLAWEHGLDVINITDKQGRMQNTPQNLLGLTFAEAKDQMLALFEPVKTVEMAVPQLVGGEGYGVHIQPAPQWLLDVRSISQTAKSVLDRLDVDPPSRLAMLRRRVESTQPWCVSRNGWWGLRVPVWRLTKGAITTNIPATSELEAQERASQHLKVTFNEALKEGYTLEQDTRTLDTWFTSALWPIYTRPDPIVSGVLSPTPSTDHKLSNNSGAEISEPGVTRVLYTCYDILHSWVARMLLLCTKLSNGKLPFDCLVLHGIVNDAAGRKMSKSKGNTVTAAEFVRGFGTLNGFPDFTKPSVVDQFLGNMFETPSHHYDPLAVAQARMTLAAAASKGNVCHDIETYRERVQTMLKKVAQITNYVSKVCNKQSLRRMWDVDSDKGTRPSFVTTAIVAGFARHGREVGQNIQSFSFRRALEDLERCVGVFSNYTIPAHRSQVSSDAVLTQGYRQLLRLFMPFAPQLLRAMPLPLGLATSGELLQWPDFGPVDPVGEGGFDAIESAVRQLRRQTLDGAKTAVVVAPQDFKGDLEQHKPFLEYLLKLTYNTIVDFNIQ
ncbi:Valine--tRNA ligase [Babesia sp. Xinjiang]|uniref:Valine--tRNA ligase n=1 Tax=Babesia sp. Xinjiang TaxID=462227 RepID=UPI000A23D794|nr:Valine--tRNA ligase [Babesia sp. Xinjiang]ORM40145.1 Valine--tRNA ligase [Babesia sp. Xinjiang]